MQRIVRHRSFLHTAVAVLLALGVLIQPVLGALGELHDVAHAVAAASDHGHAHHDGHEAPAADDDAPGDPVGAHSLLHQGGPATSMALLEPSLLLLPAIRVADRPARAPVAGPALARPTLPFRPPIG